jgi:AcrR family transcriptional regulator
MRSTARDAASGSDAAPESSNGRELRARGRRTLRSLLDAGALVFADRGFHAARVDDIVSTAKTSHGTFYLYFASKDELFRALAEEAATAMVALARELPDLSPDDEGRARLHTWLEGFADLYAAHGAVIRTWTEAEIVESDIGRIGGDLVAEFSRELARRIRVAAPELDARLTAVALVAMIERAAYYLESRQVRVGRDEMVATLSAVTHASLFGAGARSSP